MLFRSDDVFEAQWPERLPHNLARGLARETVSPRSGIKVVTELDLWPAMLQWLQPAVTDQPPAVAVLDGPEAPAKRGLVLDLLRDLPLDVLACVWADPSRDELVLVDLGEGIEIASMQRAHSQARGPDRKQLRQQHQRAEYMTRQADRPTVAMTTKSTRDRRQTV